MSAERSRISESATSRVVLVPVFVDKFVRAWPEHDDDHRVEYLPLADALARLYRTDAHVAAYSMPELRHRLSRGALARLDGPVTMVFVGFDVDCPKELRVDGHAPATWWAAERAKLFDLLEEHPGFAYRTRGGYRIVFLLERPIFICDEADATAWAERYVAWCRYIERRFAIAPDRKCKEWQRLFRLPHATRDAAPEQLEVIGDPSAIGTWCCELAAEDRAPSPAPAMPSPRPLHRTGERELIMRRARAYMSRVPGAVSGDGGHQQTWDGAINCIRGFDLDASEAREILVDYNRRCDPPWSERELEHKLADIMSAQQVGRGWLLQEERPAPTSSPAKPSTGPAPVEEGTDWAPPAALPTGLAPIPRMEPEMLPEALRPWLVDIAERMQCPIEYAAVTALVALGIVIGRRCGIRPKRYDNWTEVPNLWGAVVGPPGVMKSPAQTEALRPLKRLEAAAYETHDQAVRDFESALVVAKARRDQIVADIKKAIKDGADPKEHQARLAALPEPKPPTPRRYIVNDATVEKLGELLNENPIGLGHYRDELPGWLRTLDRDGHENDRAFFLEAWSGKSDYTYDRIARGTIRIKAACVSVLGGVQPGPLTDYLLGAVRGGGGDDGLMQRFQMLVCPDISAEPWKNVDRAPDTNAKNRAFAVFERLDAFTIAGTETDRDGLPYLHFCDDAQAVFDGWRSTLENRLRSADEAPVMVAHLAKYRKLMPSLALIFHLAEGAWTDAIGGPVSATAARMAVRWCEVLEAHARRIYAVVIRRAESAAAILSARIQAGKLGRAFTLRDVRRHGWSGLTEAEDIAGALELLEEHGWVRGAEVKTGGRPKVTYYVNPAVEVKP